MNIKPVNGHVIIEPMKQESFMASQRDTYEEIGIVVSIAADTIKVRGLIAEAPVHKGDKVYFDSWLAARYPKEGKTDEFYWLVKWEDVRAVEYAEPTVSE